MQGGSPPLLQSRGSYGGGPLSEVQGKNISSITVAPENECVIRDQRRATKLAIHDDRQDDILVLVLDDVASI